MLKKYIMLVLFTISAIHGIFAQQANIELQGRWARGPGKALFKRGGFVFVGSGSYLQVYMNRDSSYDFQDEIITPGIVEDIWVQKDTTHIYLACGAAGLQVVKFQYNIRQFEQVIGKGHDDTPGYATGIMHYGNHVYLADGSGGFKIFNVDYPSSPELKDGYDHNDQPGFYAHDVWIHNTNTAFVAAGKGGLYSFDISNVNAIGINDSIQFPAKFFDAPQPFAYRLLVIDNLAYVAAGYGSLRIVDVSTPTDILGKELTTGVPYHSNEKEILDVWVENNYAYLACGKDGIDTHVNISNPANLKTNIYSYKTSGTVVYSLIVEHDSLAYVANGTDGHLFLDVDIDNSPILLESFPGVDFPQDVDIAETHAYVATGSSGLKIFSLDIADPPNESLKPVGAYDTEGEAMDVKISGVNAYIADGSNGAVVLNVFNPTALDLITTEQNSNDTCYAVDASDGFAFFAFRELGLLILNINAGHSIAAASPLYLSSSTKDIFCRDHSLYILDNQELRIFDISGLPNELILQTSIDLDATFTNNDMRSVTAYGDSVYLANGEHGILLWDKEESISQTRSTQDTCTDISVYQRNIFTTESDSGLSIYSISSREEIIRRAFYYTGGRAAHLDINGNGSKIAIIDRVTGLHILSNEIKPGIAIDADSLDFGLVPYKYSRKFRVQVTNTGTANLIVDTIQVVGAGDSTFTFSTETFTVDPGDYYNLYVTFQPTLADIDPLKIIAKAVIKSNADDVDIALFGKVGTYSNTGPYPSDPLDIFTQGLYHFNENDGVQFTSDASQNHNFAQWDGNPSRVESQAGFDRAMNFDGQNDVVKIPYIPEHNFTTSPFTVECFFSISQKPQVKSTLIKKGENDSQFELALSNEEGKEGLLGRIWNEYGIAQDISYGTLQDFNTNWWYHAALSWDGDSLYLYLNGFVMVSKAFTGKLQNKQSGEIYIGSNKNLTSPFAGTIDEVRISSIARQDWEFHVTLSRILVNRDTLDFGNVIMNKNRSLSFDIKNEGAQLLSITSIELSPELSTLAIYPNETFYLMDGESETITATFSPVSQISLEDQEQYIIINSNDMTFPKKYIALQGNGITSLQAGAYPADPFTVGLYHFDDLLSGKRVEDDSQYSLNGRLIGNATLNNNNFKFDSGKSLYCDGENAFMKIETTQNIPLYPKWGGVTVEFWLYVSSLPTGNQETILIQRGNASNYQFKVALNAQGRVSGSTRNTSGDIFTITNSEVDTVELQKWYHIAFVVSDSLKLLLNNRQTAITDLNGVMQGSVHQLPDDTLSISVGASSNEESHHLHGYIDELRISNIDRKSWEFNVIDARLNVSVDDLNFGQVVEGQTREQTIVISNEGSSPLEIKNISKSDPKIFVMDSIAFPFILDGDNDTKEIMISFRPVESKAISSDITIHSSDPFLPTRIIILSGEGVAQADSGQYTIDEYTLELFDFTKDSIDLSQYGNAYVTWSDSGRYGDAVQILKGGYLRFPMVSGYHLNQTPLSLEFWFQFHELPNQAATLFRWGSGETNTIEIRLDPGKGLIVQLLSTTGELETLLSIPYDELNSRQWYHTALTWDLSYFRYYLNNALKSKRSYTKNISLNAMYPIYLGAADTTGTNQFTGLFDELRISNIERKSYEFSVLPPNIWINPFALDFSQVITNESRSLDFLIKNQGDQDLKIEDIISNQSAFTISPDSGFTLPRLTSRTLTITFKPTRPDTNYKEVLSISSNDSTESISYIDVNGSSVRIQKFSSFDDNAPKTVALYHFDRSSNDFLGIDTLLIDNSGSGRMGYLVGTTREKAGLFGSDAIYFDGWNDYVWIDSHSSLEFDMSRDPFTIEFSFRVDTLVGTQTLISKGVEDTVSYQFLLNRYGQLMIPGFDTTAQAYTDGFWHQLAFLYQPDSETQLYIDGQLISTRLFFRFPNMDIGRPLLFGASETIRDFMGNYFFGYLDEFRISDIIRGSWEITIPDYGIQIARTYPVIPTFTEDLIIYITIPTQFNADTIRVYYRMGGENRFTRLTAGGPTQDKQVSIPQGHITNRGLEYYIEVIDDALSYTYPMVEPHLNPAYISIPFQSMTTEWEFYDQIVENSVNQGTNIQKAGFISIPYQMDASYIDSVFQEIMPYDPYQWRLFWWHPVNSQNDYYNNVKPFYYDFETFKTDSNIFSFDPGRAFWLVLRNEENFNLNAGKTVATDTVFYTDLKSGWNMVGCPYAFPVDWSDCYNSSSHLINDLVRWSQDGYVYSSSRFEPWQGYWVHNPDSDPARLYVPPIASSSTVGAGKQLPAVKMEKYENEWSLKLTLSNDQWFDHYNYIGVRCDASDGRDQFDFVEAPPISHNISLFFDHRDWKVYPEIYTTDYRKTGQNGYIWEFATKSTVSKNHAELRWCFINTLPENFEAYLFDLTDLTAINLELHNTTTIKLNKNKRYKIIAGNLEFLKANNEGISLKPIAFHMDQNYPNPFNPSTTIRYSIPKRAKVKLVIYNILGQQVQTVVDGFHNPGYYEFVWNGKNNYGRQVASGVYICRLQMENDVHIKKMVLVR